jgi:hypothetical protein
MAKNKKPEATELTMSAASDSEVDSTAAAQTLGEIALMDDVCQLPKAMQKVYLQLIAAIDRSLQRLRPAGAAPEQLSEEFIEVLVNQIIDEQLDQPHVESRVEQEFQRQILLQSEFATLC